jgi:hypothetical protein
MDLQELAQEIKTIKDNHLKHMADDIDKIDKKVEKMDNRVWAILIILVSAVLLPAVVSFIKANT